jgi:hypothetical protein
LKASAEGPFGGAVEAVASTIAEAVASGDAAAVTAGELVADTETAVESAALEAVLPAGEVVAEQDAIKRTLGWQ